MTSFASILNAQKEFFNSNATKDIDFRKEQLKKLKEIILSHLDLLNDGLQKDFGKSAFDTYTTEVAIVIKEIDFYLENLNSLAKPKTVHTDLVNQVGFSYVYPEPLGCTLIIGPWNYPYQLTLAPLVSAIAAGNTAIVKPSEIASQSMQVIQQLINDHFDKNYIHCVLGGVDETTELLKLKFDKIFFTGSTRVGKIIYKAAAENLTPVTLELGGKSPTIVSQDADLKVAAKRIVWGKLLNAGQTCVAPDYVMVHQKVEKEFIDYLKYYLDKFDYTADSPHYTKIINEDHYDRLMGLINQDKVIIGGQGNRNLLHIEPTILKDVDWSDPVMQEEIFGPILPIMTYQNIYKVFEQIKEHPKPLAAYLFTNNSAEKDAFLEQLSFGGGCINDTIMHLVNSESPFGGVGDSGIGSYHGKYGFEAFSHQKSVIKRATWGETSLKYPPYSEDKLKWAKRLINGIK